MTKLSLPTIALMSAMTSASTSPAVASQIDEISQSTTSTLELSGLTRCESLPKKSEIESCEEHEREERKEKEKRKRDFESGAVKYV